MDAHIYGRGHLSGDLLKWRQDEMRGIIIFPMMQQLSLIEFIIFIIVIDRSISYNMAAFRLRQEYRYVVMQRCQNCTFTGGVARYVNDINY